MLLHVGINGSGVASADVACHIAHCVIRYKMIPVHLRRRLFAEMMYQAVERIVVIDFEIIGIFSAAGRPRTTVAYWGGVALAGVRIPVRLIG